MLENMCAECQTLILKALQSYMLGGEMDIDKIQAQKFAEYMLRRIKDKLESEE